MGEILETTGGPLQVPAMDGDNELRFSVGKRVHAVGNRRRNGTVRYIGPVEGYPGVWVGVEWDDGEGKHDGRVAGITYFTASKANSASFVRSKSLSSGISLLEALFLRYRSECTKEEEDEMYVLSSSKRRVSIHFIGKSKIEEKFKHFEDLHGASISYLGIGSVNPLNEISNTVPNLKELDLTGNLLSRMLIPYVKRYQLLKSSIYPTIFWRSMYQILRHLKKFAFWYLITVAYLGNRLKESNSMFLQLKSSTSWEIVYARQCLYRFNRSLLMSKGSCHCAS